MIGKGNKMKKKLLLILIPAVLLLSLTLSACQTGGIPQARYDQINAQLTDAQSKLTQAQSDLAKAQADKAAGDNDLINAKATVKDLQNQVNALQAQLVQSSLTGATPAETAAKIVKYYHETHVYSTTDFFICGDMASEVWNMLKAQGIGALIAIGDINNPITNILQCDHAWVLAEVGAGEYLALETTGGRTVTRSENPLYYRGWTFSSPADLKANNDLRKEYNIRVDVRNQINNEVNKVAALHNNASSQAEADKYKAVYDKLVELRTAQEATLNDLMNKIQNLATPLG
jgi:hypothetical protein